MPSLASCSAHAVEAVVEQVGQGHDLDVLLLQRGACGHVLGVIAGRGIDDLGGGAQRIEHRAGPPAAAADQADLDRVAAGGMGAPSNTQPTGQCGPSHKRRREFQKIPS